MPDIYSLRGYFTCHTSFFFSQVLVRMKQYKDDLLASCLQLLLSLPKELVELEFVGLVSALQVISRLSIMHFLKFS